MIVINCKVYTKLALSYLAATPTAVNGNLCGLAGKLETICLCQSVWGGVATAGTREGGIGLWRGI